MKPEHKIIVEVSTQSEWDTVTSFFGIKWDIGQRWSLYKERAAICPYDDNIGFPSCGNRDTIVDYLSKGYERLTYPEFEARFLNNKTMNIKDCLTDLKTEAEQIRSDIGMAKQRLDWLVDMIEKSQQVEPEKKVWTVEDVYNEVRPEKQFNYMPDGSSVIENMPYKSYDIGKYYFYNDKHCEKVFAFGHLLTVAHWANEGGDYDFAYAHFATIKDGKPFRYETDVLSADNRKMPSPLMFKSRESYDKFMSVHGVEDLLKTFFGIEE